jgi:hypothetical protein
MCVNVCVCLRVCVQVNIGMEQIPKLFTVHTLSNSLQGTEIACFVSEN